MKQVILFDYESGGLNVIAGENDENFLYKKGEKTWENLNGYCYR